MASIDIDYKKVRERAEANNKAYYSSKSSVPDGYRVNTNSDSYKATQSNMPNSSGGITVNNGGGATPSYRASSFNYQRPTVSYQDALKQAQAQYDPLRQQTLKDIADQTQQARYQAGNMAAAQGVSHSGLAADQQNKLSIAQNDQQSRANTQFDSQIANLAQSYYQFQQNQAEQQYRDAYQQYLDNRNFGYQQSVNDRNFSYQQGRDSQGDRMNEAQLTGVLGMSPQAMNTYNQLMALKQQAESSSNPGQYQQLGDQLRNQLVDQGVTNANQLFGSNVNAQQAFANYQKAGTPTLAALQQAYNQRVTDAGLTGMYNGQPTLDKLQFVQQSAVQNAGLTGMYNGKPTLDAQREQRLSQQDSTGSVGTPKISKTVLNSEIDKRILQAAQMNREQPGTEGMIGFIKNQIVPDIPQMMDMGLGLNDINNIIDRTVSAFTNGQFKSKKEYYSWLKENMGDAEFEKWKKENDFTLNFNQQAKGGGYNNYWKLQREADQVPSKVKTASNAIQQALNDTGTPSSWLKPMLEIAGRESTWNPASQNDHSTAYGMFQFLNPTWKGTGISKTSDPYKQSVAAIKYIKGKYGTPENALTYWDQNKSY